MRALGDPRAPYQEHTAQRFPRQTVRDVASYNAYQSATQPCATCQAPHGSPCTRKLLSGQANSWHPDHRRPPDRVTKLYKVHELYMHEEFASTFAALQWSLAHAWLDYRDEVSQTVSFVAHEAQRFRCLRQSLFLGEGRANSPRPVSVLYFRRTRRNAARSVQRHVFRKFSI